MTTQNETDSSNGYLTALWAIGSILTVIGGIMWLANSSEASYGEERNLVAQAAGAGLLGTGVSFIALSLVAAAVCHQIRQSAQS